MTSNDQTNGTSKGNIDRTTISHFPVELDDSDLDMFTLVTVVINGKYGLGKQQELRIRCNCCNWGYNSRLPGIRLSDLGNIGHRAELHVDACRKTGRTIDLNSIKIGD